MAPRASSLGGQDGPAPPTSLCLTLPPAGGAVPGHFQDKQRQILRKTNLPSNPSVLLSALRGQAFSRFK